MKNLLVLGSVPETMLWTLQNRAMEAMRPDSIIQDQKSIEIYQTLVGNRERTFGKPEPSHAIRSLDFDEAIEAFLQQHPDGTIVSLGEGLETQRFRIKAPVALWISVDLPEVIAIREQFIQPDKQHLHIAASATTDLWLDSVPRAKPVFIAAQGLMMYFDERTVRTLLQTIANTFEQAFVVFDTIPCWFAAKTQSANGLVTSSGYKAPAMLWGINRNQIAPSIEKWLPRNNRITVNNFSNFPRGAMKWLYPLICATPFLKNRTPSIVNLIL